MIGKIALFLGPSCVAAVSSYTVQAAQLFVEGYTLEIIRSAQQQEKSFFPKGLSGIVEDELCWKTFAATFKKIAFFVM